MLTLVDSSVWTSHFHRPDKRVIDLLESSQILIHSAVLGELAAGSIKNRVRVLSDLKMIPNIPEISSEEVMEFIEIRKLHGRGLSWVDIQILASCLVAGRGLLTEDSRLRRTFESMR
ncbi:PIN domain-containing protein [Bdellovibrionota bacterium FG-1]